MVHFFYLLELSFVKIEKWQLGMIYAMLSIGILGFIVWGCKMMMALFYGDIKVINIAKCWEGSNF